MSKVLIFDVKNQLFHITESMANLVTPSGDYHFTIKDDVLYVMYINISKIITRDIDVWSEIIKINYNKGAFIKDKAFCYGGRNYPRDCNLYSAFYL